MRISDLAPPFAEPEPLGFDFVWLGAGWATGYFDRSGQAWFGWSSSIRYAGFGSGDLSEWLAAVGGS